MMNKITITIEQIKLNPNLDLSERTTKYSTKEESSKEDIEELALASIKQEYEYWANNRTNISERTDNMLQSILNGHILNNIEGFEMFCDDPVKVEKYTKYEILKKKISDNGGISLDDFNALCSTIGFDSNTTEQIKNAFLSRGLIIESCTENNSFHR